MLLVLDCNYICWCHAYGIGQALSYGEQRTEVIYGFLKQILVLAEKFSPNQIVFCWDSGNYKRKDLYPDYKKKDPPVTPEEAQGVNLVLEQFNHLREYIIPYLGFTNIFHVKGYEADDLIATLVMKYGPSEPIVVVSRDKDLYQLLDYCTLYSITGRATTTKEEFVRNRNITPVQWATVKAMMGCTSDKVEGIKGVGEKTAIGYLTGTVNKGKAYLKIKDSQDIIDRNMKLVKLPFEGTPTPKLSGNNMQTKNVAYGSWKSVCQHYGLQSLMDRESIEKWKTLVNCLE